MKKLIVLAAVCLFGNSAFAGKIVKDRSGAYRCVGKSGDTISYYTPYGRVPTTAEQTTCIQKGGKIKKPSLKAAIALSYRSEISGNNKIIRKNNRRLALLKRSIRLMQIKLRRTRKAYLNLRRYNYRLIQKNRHLARKLKLRR